MVHSTGVAAYWCPAWQCTGVRHGSGCKERPLQHGAPGAEPSAVGQLRSPWCPRQSGAAPALPALGQSPRENQEGFLHGKVGVGQHLESRGGGLGTQRHALGQFGGWMWHPERFGC